MAVVVVAVAVSVAVVVALDLLGVYLREKGAIGGPVGDRD